MKKRLLAILLAVCMVISMAPAAFAAGSVFTDVKAGDWFAEEVEYVYANGLMNGVGDNKFDPNGNVTRAMMWTTLARIAGENTTGSDPWWLAGQQWAMKTGVSDGTMATDNITREQLVTMLYRYAQLERYDVSVGEDTNILSYTDAFDVNEWAIAAMQWACGAGIINGIDGALQPQGYATRAQLAAILYRFVEEVVNAAPATYIVTFMWNYGNKGIYETVEVEEGETVGSLRNPSRSGYSFSGWYTEDGDRFTLSTRVTEDIVVYAKWSKDVYIPSHTHSYGDWAANNDGTHTGYCSCGNEKTEDCVFGEFVSNEDGTHSRTCFKCSGVETQNCVYTDYICSDCGHDVSDGVTILYPQDTADENYTMLKAAIDAAQDGDVIYLGAGTFELQTVLEINNKTISIVGVEDGVVLKNMRTNKGHLFTIKNHTDPENNPQVVMTNITLDQNNNPSGHGIYVRGSVTVDLYDVVITNATAASIIMDHAYAYDDGNYYDGTRIVVNAYNVDLDAAGFVQMGALPMASVANVTTYAEFNYDSESTIPSFKADGYNRGYGNLTVNGEPLYPDSYFVEEDGIIYLKDTVNDELTLWNIPTDYESNSLVVAEGTTALNGGVFAGTSITTVTIPATVTDFGATGVTETNASGGAFKNSSVTTVVLEDGMTEIPDAAFNGAKNLASVNIPASVETIGIHAFRQTALTELTIPATVITIKNGAFRDMSNLTTITFEGDDIVIPNYVCRSCPNLSNVYILCENVSFGGSQAFCHSDNGDATDITIYVANEDVKKALETTQTSAYGYTIVVMNVQIGSRYYSTLQEAVDAAVDGDTITLLKSCKMPDGSENVSLRDKTLTITGTKDTALDVSEVDARDQFVTGATLKFEGITLDFGYENYMGFANTASLTYKDCDITGLQFLFGESVTFEGCKIDSSANTKEPHAVWTYGAKNVSFTDCDFIYGNRGINCYSDNDVEGGKQTVNFTDCTFTTTATDSEGAVEINSCYFSDGIYVTLDNCTAPENGDMAYVSQWDSGKGAKTTIIIDGVQTVVSQAGLDAAINAATGTVTVALAAGEYKMPSSNTTANITITGSKDVVINNTLGAYLDNATLTFEGVSFEVGTGKANGNGSDYAALYSKNVTYTDCTFSGPFRIGRDGATFTGCNFKDLGNDYVWTYGNDATFTDCTFNSDGKALLIYSDGGSEVSQVSVTNCVFNATTGAKAGAIANQNCAAIEIHNYGNGVNLTTSGNAVGEHFSGEWRIKTYENGKPAVIVNGTTYTSIAIDGKTMTIDSDKNVTVTE